MDTGYRSCRRARRRIGSGRDPRYLFRSHFKRRTRPIEADIELHEEVDLTQQHRHSIRPCPREREPNRREAAHNRRDDQRPSFTSGEVTTQRHRRGLLIPSRSQPLPDALRQNVDCPAGIQEARNRDRVRPGQRDRQERARLAAPRFGSHSTNGYRSPSTVMHRPSPRPALEAASRPRRTPDPATRADKSARRPDCADSSAWVRSSASS